MNRDLMTLEISKTSESLKFQKRRRKSIITSMRKMTQRKTQANLKKKRDRLGSKGQKPRRLSMTRAHQEVKIESQNQQIRKIQINPQRLASRDRLLEIRRLSEIDTDTQMMRRRPNSSLKLKSIKLDWRSTLGLDSDTTLRFSPS